MNATTTSGATAAPAAAGTSDTSLPLFFLGQLYSTPGAIAAADAAGVDLLRLVIRHQRGDFGDIDADDKAANQLALLPAAPDRIVSAYVTAAGRILVITEHDRSSTTVLLAEEY